MGEDISFSDQSQVFYPLQTGIEGPLKKTGF
jgi:hypothetical protein